MIEIIINEELNLIDQMIDKLFENKTLKLQLQTYSNICIPTQNEKII